MPDLLPAQVVLLAGEESVERPLLRALLHASLHAADALHEELVVEHSHDSRELHALEQGEALALGQREHATSEPQPGDLAGNVGPRVIDRHGGLLPGGH